MLPVRGARGARGKRPFRRGEVSGAAVRSSEEIWEAYRRKPDGISTSLVFLTLHLELEKDCSIVAVIVTIVVVVIIVVVVLVFVVNVVKNLWLLSFNFYFSSRYVVCL